MTLQEVKDLINSGDMARCRDTIDTHCMIKNIYDSLKQYNPKQHDVVTDKQKRPDKQIKNEAGEFTRTV